ncbi:MAG TPA: DUF2851 family protein, partial [Puia sp.]|nr:DUF2851 family protein [Puia sp.]
LRILSPGELNTDAGPDFRNARIRLNDKLQEGPVELHIKASDWDRHGHARDPNYRGVILHVVWENDGGPADLAVLVLQHRVSKLLLGQYEKWMKSQLFVPCAAQLQDVGSAAWTRWKEDLLLRRLYRWTLIIRDWLSANHQHWEETTWWLMARSLGLPVNGSAFEAIAKSIPLRLLARYRWEPAILKGLLLGQAGLLELPSEYRFLQAKHRLEPISTPILFLRMRPAHAPARRLVQLAELFSSGESWFAKVRDAGSPGELKSALQADGLGPDMKRGLLINAFVPVLFAYGLLRKEPACRDRALAWLAAEKPEKNTRIARWQRLGVPVLTAADSQSLLELKKTYCDCRRCLDCAIGQSLLGDEPNATTGIRPGEPPSSN